MTIQVPIVNAPYLNLQGLNLGWTSGTVITVAAGRARNVSTVAAQSNLNDITLSAAVTINAATTGAAGLDQGALANSTFYAVYAIGDSSGFNSGSAVLSTSTTGPLMPDGYDMYRRIGYVLTSGAAAILAFDQRGSGVERTMTYRASIATDITSGSSATFAAVDVSDSVPAIATDIIFKCHFTPTAADDELALRSGDSATDEGQAVASGSVAAVVTAAMLTCPCNATSASAVDYKVTGSAVAINVQGYVDQL